MERLWLSRIRVLESRSTVETTLLCSPFGPDDQLNANTAVEEKDGSGIGTGTNRLKFQVTRADLNVKYECRVYHPALDSYISSSTQLEVNVRPNQLVLSGVEHHVVQGTTVLLKCEVFGARPPANVKWFNATMLLAPEQNSTRLNEGDGTYNTSSTLVFTATRYENEAIITCEATNEVAASRREVPLRESIKLEVLYPPLVWVVPDNITVNESTDVLMFCSYESNPSSILDVKWFKDEVEIEKEADSSAVMTDHTLLIKNSTRDDMGAYSCSLTNEVGTSMSNSTTRVSVHYKPEVNVTMDPQSPIVEDVVTNVTLSCNVMAGNPPDLIKVRWFFNGVLIEELPNCTNETLCVDDPSKLLLMNIDRQMHGNYTCMGKNEAGWGVMAEPSELIIYYPPSQVSLTYHPQRVVKRGSVNLICAVKEIGRPSNTTFRWTRGSHKVMDVTTANWTIDPVTLETESNFTCTALNLGGESESASVYIRVDAPPTFIERLPMYYGVVMSSQNISISCRVECSPICSIKWLKGNVNIYDLPNGKAKYWVDNRMIPPDTRTNDFQSIHSTLNWNMTAWPKGYLDRMLDNANYTCSSTGNSAGGGVKSTAFFAVEYPPENVTLSNTVVNVIEGNIPEKVICQAKGFPEATYDWRRAEENDVVVKGGTFLLNLPVSKRNAGNYTCRAQNRHGQISGYMFINVLYKPECGITRKEVDGKTVLVCTAQSNPPEVDFVWKIKNENETVEDHIENKGLQSFLTLESRVEQFRTYLCYPNNSVGVTKKPCEVDVPGVTNNDGQVGYTRGFSSSTQIYHEEVKLSGRSTIKWPRESRQYVARNVTSPTTLAIRRILDKNASTELKETHLNEVTFENFGKDVDAKMNQLEVLQDFPEYSSVVPLLINMSEEVTENVTHKPRENVTVYYQTKQELTSPAFQEKSSKFRATGAGSIWMTLDTETIMILIAILAGIILVIIIIIIIICIVCRRKQATDKYNTPVELEDRENPEGSCTNNNNNVPGGTSTPMTAAKWPMRPGVLVHVNTNHSLLSTPNGRSPNESQASRASRIRAMFGPDQPGGSLPGVFHSKSGVVTFKRLEPSSETNSLNRKRKKPGGATGPNPTGNKDLASSPNDALLPNDADKAFYENLPFHNMANPQSKASRPPSRISSGYGSSRSQKIARPARKFLTVRPLGSKPRNWPQFRSLRLTKAKNSPPVPAPRQYFPKTNLAYHSYQNVPPPKNVAKEPSDSNKDADNDRPVTAAIDSVGASVPSTVNSTRVSQPSLYSQPPPKPLQITPQSAAMSQQVTSSLSLPDNSSIAPSTSISRRDSHSSKNGQLPVSNPLILSAATLVTPTTSSPKPPASTTIDTKLYPVSRTPSILSQSSRSTKPIMTYSTKTVTTPLVRQTSDAQKSPGALYLARLSSSKPKSPASPNKSINSPSSMLVTRRPSTSVSTPTTPSKPKDKQSVVDFSPTSMLVMRKPSTSVSTPTTPTKPTYKQSPSSLHLSSMLVTRKPSSSASTPTSPTKLTDSRSNPTTPTSSRLLKPATLPVSAPLVRRSSSVQRTDSTSECRLPIITGVVPKKLETSPSSAPLDASASDSLSKSDPEDQNADKPSTGSRHHHSHTHHSGGRTRRKHHRRSEMDNNRYRPGSAPASPPPTNRYVSPDSPPHQNPYQAPHYPTYTAPRSKADYTFIKFHDVGQEIDV
ncbi:hypothetical protein GE061_009507 [Apolygus lucorum]|uniref:Ig-like domain-containing protein n=1 Tax=Apolygus lucorum TaxID=248454 RepID=A0A8S9Y1Q5_APOLU|nr:hypothetical protein GE061_009507 [Apolygus lucorum]